MKRVNKQKGFTIIELVVVILLLGILTATALPRFMDVTDEAHAAVVNAVIGGKQTGVALFRAQWVAEGEPLSAAVTEFNLFASAEGYPIGSDATLSTTADCVAVYTGVMQAGGLPSIHPTGEAASAADLVAGDIDGTITGVAFVPHLNTTSEVCQYVYIGQFDDAADGALPVINYDTTTGEVELGSPL